MKNLFVKLVSTLPFLFVFAANIFTPIDADFGWHLKYGEYFYQHLSPLRQNIFSTMMPDYLWPNSSWITDIITYTAFHLGGFIGVSLLGAAVVTLTFFFLAKAFKLNFLSRAILFPIIVYLELPINTISFRGQQLSLLFLSILLFLLETREDKVFKFRFQRYFLIPFLFLMWVNTHGEFLLGLGVLGLYAAGNIVQVLLEKKAVSFRLVFPSLKFWSLLFLCSVLATFIDPFGFSTYTEALTHIGNADLKYIIEYLPFDELSSSWRYTMIVGSLLGFGVFIFFFSEKLFKKISLILIVFFLFVLTLWIKRFAWPFYYTTPAVLSAYFSFQKKEKFSTYFIGSIVLILTAILGVWQNNPGRVLTFGWENYCKAYMNCSLKSAEFLKNRKLSEPLWTNYDWGGFLIWNYPEIKPAIDGRMHLWKDEKGYSAFDEYYPLEQNEKDIDKSRFNSAYVSRRKPIYDRLLELTQENKWKKLYEDSSAAVFTRNSQGN
ncbi:MAG: hypothetical protein ACM3IJ_05150 [Candidatus Levyibacteriota bacterium]